MEVVPVVRLLKFSRKYRSILNLLVVVGLLVGTIAPLSAQDANPAQVPQNDNMTVQALLPLVASNANFTKQVNAKFLVIETNPARAAELGIEPTAQCREFEPADTAAQSSGLNAFCATSYKGIAVICTKDGKPGLCALFTGQWFWSSLQGDEASLPDATDDGELAKSTYVRTCDPADKTCAWSQIDSKNGVNAMLTQSTPEYNRMMVARKIALDTVEAANEGVPQLVDRVIAGLQVMYGTPPTVERRGILENLCGQYMPASIYMRATGAIIWREEVYVNVRFYTDVTGIFEYLPMTTCMQAHDAEWTTWSNWRELMPAQYKKQLDDNYDDTIGKFTQSSAQAAVGTQFAVSPSDVQEITFYTIVWGAATYVIYGLGQMSGSFAY